MRHFLTRTAALLILGIKENLLHQCSWIQTSMTPWELEIWRPANVSALSKLNGAPRDANDNTSLTQLTQRITVEGNWHTEQRTDNASLGRRWLYLQTLLAQQSLPSVTVRNNFFQKVNLICKNFNFVSAQSLVSGTPLVFHKHLWNEFRMSLEGLITHNSESTWATVIWSLKYLCYNFAEPDEMGCFCFLGSSL